MSNVGHDSVNFQKEKTQKQSEEVTFELRGKQGMGEGPWVGQHGKTLYPLHYLKFDLHVSVL